MALLSSMNLRSGFTFWMVLSLMLISGQSDLTQMPDLSTLDSPPEFTHSPNPTVLWYVLNCTENGDDNGDINTYSLKQQTLYCTAKGNPTPRYKWFKNGEEFRLDGDPRISKVGNDGSFTIKDMVSSDRGNYTCHAINKHGTAVDRPTQLKVAYSENFKHRYLVMIPKRWMDAHEQTCYGPKGAPNPSIFWLLKSKTQGFRSLNSPHISMVSENGKSTIYFSYVDDRTIDNELLYTCATENKVLNDYKFGSPFQFSLDNMPADGQRVTKEPMEQHVNNDDGPVRALKSGSVDLHCIFSGYPVKIPEWKKDYESIQPNDRFDYQNFGRTLRIKNIRLTDQGKYQCKFRGNPALNRQFELIVEAAPYFSKPPSSVTSAEGETVKLACSANGKPSPTIKFYKNGEPIYGDGDRVLIKNNETLLEIQRLNSSDIAAYQCGAENEHGSIWSSFALNLLPKNDTTSL